jgi:hypothetical protein
MAILGRTSERLKRLRGSGAGFGSASGFSNGGPDTLAGAGTAQNPFPSASSYPVSSAPAQPGSRDMRAHAVHRLQVGLFGLAAMLLLVSLASVIMQRVQTADRSAIGGEPTGAASATPANDPLVDLGVAPEVPVAGTAPARKPARTEPAH